jgi:nucleotide-binding universal stress UspA family protein
MHTQHFLVPIDFSAYSDQALTYATTLATQLQAHLTLLHVIHELSMVMGDMASALPEAYLQELEAEAQRSLEERLNRVHEARLEADMVIVHGVPFQCIIDTAHDQKVDLIVMGTHGRTGLSHALVGSVAEKVVRLASCPVLVTRGATSTAVQ